MDYKNLHSDLTKKLESEIPITAYPVRELVQILRGKGNPFTLKSKLLASRQQQGVFVELR